MVKIKHGKLTFNLSGVPKGQKARIEKVRDSYVQIGLYKGKRRVGHRIAGY